MLFLSPLNLTKIKKVPTMIKSIISSAALIFCVFALQATAYAANPPGSYQQTCTNIVLNGETLSASCTRFDGSQNNTELPFATSCVGIISNVDGNLVCTGATGSFARTCKDSAVANNKLSATCQKVDGSWIPSSTSFSGFQHPVTNCNGQLVDKPNC